MQSSLRTPTRPKLSRNATNLSPSKVMRNGSLSGTGQLLGDGDRMPIAAHHASHLRSGTYATKRLIFLAGQHGGVLNFLLSSSVEDRWISPRCQ